VTRLGSDLSVLSETTFGDGTWGAGLASLGSAGWLVAAAGQAGELTLTRLDGVGAVLGSPQVVATADAGTGTTFWGPYISNGVSPGLLLSWLELPSPNFDGTLHLQPLDASGALSGSEITMPHVAIWSTVGVDDGYAIAAALNPDTPNYSLQLFHLGLDGTLTAGDAITGQYEGSQAVFLAWSGVDLRMSYIMDTVQDAGGSTGHVPGSYLVTANKDGVLQGPPVLLDTIVNAYATYPLFVTGGDTVLLYAPNFGTTTQIGLQRWTAAPSLVWSEAEIAHGPSLIMPSLAPFQDGGVVAWQDDGCRGPSRISVELVNVAP
jgi:hypothetical protein